jgi:hypothetical protein
LPCDKFSPIKCEQIKKNWFAGLVSLSEVAYFVFHGLKHRRYSIVIIKFINE